MWGWVLWDPQWDWVVLGLGCVGLAVGWVIDDAGWCGIRWLWDHVWS